MSLGADNAICRDEFIDAMFQRLEDEEPGLGENVREPGVEKNLTALGEAVFQILTGHAETVSDVTEDAGFWQWVTEVNTWLAALATWQQSVDQAFANWVPTQPAEQNLRADLIAVPDPGAPPILTPTSLRGRIE